jgi:hypothetical protein
MKDAGRHEAEIQNDDEIVIHLSRDLGILLTGIIVIQILTV